MTVCKPYSTRVKTFFCKLLALHAGEIDLEYLKKTACKQQVEDVLTEALRQSEAYIKAVKRNF